MIKNCLFILILILYSSSSNAQDPKFSQYFAAPLLLNPALTGYFDGDYRVAANMRQQWANIGAPYNTYSLSGEIKLNDEFYHDDIFAIGISALYDESFNKFLKASNLSAGFSYYKFLDPNHNVKIGLAPQVSYVTKRLDFDALTVASQFQDGSFNLSLPNYLDLNSNKLSYFDFNVGANIALSLNKISASLGYAAYHLTRPNQSLFNDLTVKLPYRHTINFSFRYTTDDLVDLNFSAHQLREGSSRDAIVGAVIGFKPTFESKLKLNTGLWYQSNGNSFFPFVGFDFSTISLGFNYGLFSKNIANYQPRTFELSIILRDNTFTKFKNTCKF
ncbi:MAG: PorP/SprF family type IX secretion system membrane protein [Bacteroidota bacterium]